MLRRLVVFFSALLSCLGADPIDAVRGRFEHPPDDARIMMRWWWFGPSLTREGAEAEMLRMKQGGIGGFEVQPTYPLSLTGNYRWLSPEFLDVLGFTALKARELGLRMDLTIGSGWSFGGPYITQDLAAGQLRSERLAIVPSVTSLARPTPGDGEKLIAAFVGLGSLQEVDPLTFKPLAIAGQGRIPVPAGDGPRTVVYYFSSHTGQAVKRAAYGAEGYVLDHYSRAAIETHLKEAGDKMLAAVGPGGVHAIFCDSLEVYDSDWPVDMSEQFRQRRGYDLLPLLPLLQYDAGDRSAALRRDFGRTLTELYEERFLLPMREWSRKNRVLFRIQNYGQPPATISSSRHADLLDGEGWHWRGLTASRWASSASHLFGKPVTASETWTWIHSPVFRATPLDLKAEADQHFLMGINQLIGHGWPYSPPQAGSPGWSFYAAGVFNDKNPWWPVMPDLSLYLQRLSYLLRQGEPVTDVALYAPTEDAWSTFKPGTLDNLNLFRKTRDWVGGDIIPAILDAGYGFDLIDDGTLAEAGRRYKAIVLPGVRLMPAESAKWLAGYERGGGIVVTKPSELARRLASTAAPDMTLRPPAPDIGFVHRRLADADVYFVANTGNQPQRVSARFRAQTDNVESWDPLTGSAHRLQAQNGEIALELEPYGSHVVVFRASAGNAPPAVRTVTAASAELRSGWTLDLAGASLQVQLPHSWAGDARTRSFSGTAVYRRQVSLSPEFRSPATRVYLDFGETQPARQDTPPEGSARADSAFAALVAAPIRDAATVFINGRRAGSVWCPPYRIDVTGLLKDGANELRIEVYNTAINQILGGSPQPDYAALTGRYGLRFRMQEMENLQVLPSGILSVPRLLAER